MGKLNGKIAVVTGASKGIGAGIAQALGREGAKVVVNYASDKAGAERVAAGIRKSGGEAVVIGGSVARGAEVQALFAETRKLFGRVDVLVNNAGVYAFGSIADFNEESYDHMFGINVKGLLLATKEAVALFPESGGSIINIGSVVSESTPPGTAVYSGTKGAVDVITRVLAKELGPKRIRVNAINPGLTATEGNVDIQSSPMADAMVQQTPLGRMGKPDDIADVVTFIASDEARWITGSLLQVGGGLR